MRGAAVRRCDGVACLASTFPKLLTPHSSENAAMNGRMATALLALIALLAPASSLGAAEVARTWRDSSGQFQIEARFVRIAGDSVVLLRNDGVEISVPVAKLSAADQAFVRTKATPVPATPPAPVPAAQPADLSATVPTPAEKIKQLSRLSIGIVGHPRPWTYGIDGKRKNTVEDMELVGIGGGVATLRDPKGGYWDVPIHHLRDDDRSAMERIARLIDKKELADERELLGSWALEPMEPGDERPDEYAPKLVLNGAEFSIYRLAPWELYVVDASQSPKRIDLGSNKAIYELNGDELRICLCNSSLDPAPTAFAIGKENQDLLVYKKLPDVMTLPILTTVQLDADLAAAINEMVTLLENGQCEAMLARFVPPAEWAKMPQAEREKAIAFIDQIRPQLLCRAKAMLRVAPKMNANQSRADFDFSRVHLDDDTRHGHPRSMIKVEGRWYIVTK
jgi:uncharacterized protein (TIGR03067 family)